MTFVKFVLMIIGVIVAYVIARLLIIGALITVLAVLGRAIEESQSATAGGTKLIEGNPSDIRISA